MTVLFPAELADLEARLLGGLEQVEAQYFTLTNSTFVRARITNGRTVLQVLPTLAGETIPLGKALLVALAGQKATWKTA